MSEAELLQTLAEINAGLVPSIALYVSVLFAYFVVAHVAGKELSLVQISLASAVYSMVMFLGLLQIYAEISTITKISGDLSAMGSAYVRPSMMGKWTPMVVTSIYFFSYVLSILYMRHSRR